jgi:hypothetical protein
MKGAGGTAEEGVQRDEQGENFEEVRKQHKTSQPSRPRVEVVEEEEPQNAFCCFLTSSKFAFLRFLFCGSSSSTPSAKSAEEVVEEQEPHVT